MFRGQHVSALMTQIKEEIGDEAMIVSMSESNGHVEIEVGIEESASLQNFPATPTVNPYIGAIPEQTIVLTPEDELDRYGQRGDLKRQLTDILTEHGVSKSVGAKIVKAAEKSFVNEMSADRYIGMGLEDLIECNSLLPSLSNVIAVCGATGVGKTTTIAKLAARLQQSFDMTIGLIAADTYRVGAGYHLQTYASLLHLPFRQIEHTGVRGAKELADAVKAFSKYDLILIDTSGCGPREAGRIEDLEKSLLLIPQAERMLVLPAPSNDFDLHAAAKSFEKINYSRIILSKVDESGFIGPVVNTLATLKKPLAFITSGQRVPEDIEPASTRRLGWMLTRAMT